jgi:hypothetical protein
LKPRRVRRTDSERHDAVVPFQDHPVAPLETAWSFDAGDATEILGDDEDFERLRSAYLWWDDAAASERGRPIRADGKLPIAKIIDGELRVVWNGLTAAVGAINGARQRPDIPADQLRGAFNHAIRYYREINKGLPDDEQKQIPEFRGDAADTDTDNDGDGDGTTTHDDSTKRELRYDRVPLLRPSVRMDNGRMFVQGFVAKPGVLVYKNADGREFRELIPADELHDPRSLETLAQAPVTLEHPRVDVDSSNVDQLAVGNVGDEVQVLKDNGFVRVSMVLRRDDVINAVRTRDKTELSPGYTVLIDPTPGVDPVFGRYDAIQRGRRYNHLAVTTAARGGHDIHLRADAAVQVVEPPPAVREAPMFLKLLLPILLSGLTAAGVSRDDADEITKPVRDFDPEKREDAAGAAESVMMTALQKAFDTMNSQLATITGERDALLQAKADQNGHEEENHDSLMEFHGERVQLEALAKANKIDTATDEVRKLDNAELRAKIVKALKPDVDLESRGDTADAYCRAFLDLHANGKSRSDTAWDKFSHADAPVDQPEGRTDGGDDKPKTTGEAYRRSLDTAFDEQKPGRV